MSEGKWKEIGGRQVRPSIVTAQQKALLKLRAILQQELEKHQGDLAVVREQLHRMKHGGGS